MAGLMYLVDTNIFLEGLLEQERVETVRSFFKSIDLDKLFISDLSLHSIGIILFNLKKTDLFIAFLNDLVIDGIEVLSLSADELTKLDTVARGFNLDFDDAYQYFLAAENNLQLISFDKDFDKTERGRKEPVDVIT